MLQCSVCGSDKVITKPHYEMLCINGHLTKFQSEADATHCHHGYELSGYCPHCERSLLVATVDHLKEQNAMMREVLEHSKTEITTAVEDCEVESLRATQHAKMVLKMLLIKLEEIDV